MSNLPSKVKIGPVAYAIDGERDMVGSGDNGEAVWLNGRFRSNHATITIDLGVDEQVARAVLVHEILHAILSHAGRKRHPERVIRALGYGVVDVLQRNPALVAYLVDTEQDEEENERD